MVRDSARHFAAPLRAVQKILIGAVLVAIGYLAALLVPLSPELRGASFNHAVAKHAVAPAPNRAPPATSGEAPSAHSPQRDFDYFPDHYQNQAKEVAEPINTF